MKNPVITFLKKTYKIIIVIAVSVLFFFLYNIYLADHSLANLQLALSQLNNAKNIQDAQKISALLDYSLLNEVASLEMESGSLSRMQLAKDILSKPESMSQVEDAKFAIKEIITEKGKKRSAVLGVLDKISQIFTPGGVKLSQSQMEDQVQQLKKKLETLINAREKQKVYYEIANLYIQLFRFGEAKQAYLELIRLDSESTLAKRAMFNIAWAEKAQGNYDVAIKQFEILANDPAAKNLATLSKYQIAEISNKKGEPEKAAKIYQQIAASQEKKDKDLSQMAGLQASYTYLYKTKELDKAREVINKAKVSIRNPEMLKHIETKVVSSLAEQYCREGFELLKQGNREVSSQKYQEALQYFDKALELLPGLGLAYSGRSLAFLWLHDAEKAMEAARKSIELAPDSEGVSLNAGYCFVKLGLLEVAITEYKRFVALNPSSAKVYYNLGCAYIVAGRIEEAASEFEQTVKIDPRLVKAYNNLGWCQWQLKSYAKSVEAFDHAIRVQPTYLDALFNLGMIYRAIGKYRDAKLKFETILKINPAYPNARSILKEIEDYLRK